MNSIAWSPSGETIAVAGSLGIYVYDANTLKEIRFIETLYPTSVSYSPDGKKVAAGGCSAQRGDMIGCAQAWSSIYEVASGKQLVRFEPAENNGGYLFFNPDGKSAASIACSANRGLGVGCVQTKITIWDVASGKSICNATGHDRQAYTLVFSPDGQRLFTFSSGNVFNYVEPSAIFWNAKTCKQIKTVVGPALSSHQTFIEREKDSFFKNTWVDDVLLQTIRSGELRDSFLGGESPNTMKTYAPANIMAVGFDTRVEIWNLKPLSKLREFYVSKYVGEFSFSPDGQRLAGLALDGVTLWDVNSGEVISQTIWQENYYLIDASGLLPDGRWVVVGSKRNTGLVYLFDPLEGKTVKTLTIDLARKVYLSPNGKWIAVTKYSSEKGDVGFALWDLETESELFATSEPVYCLAISPDGRFLAAGDYKGMFKLWDISNLRNPLPIELKGIDAFQEGVSNVQFSADSKYLFAGDWNATLQIWRLQDVQPAYTLKNSFAESFIVSPDQQRLAYLDSHNITRLIFLDLPPLLNSEARSSIAPYIVENYDWKSVFTFSPDGKIFLWGGSYHHYGDQSTIRLWDVENKKDLGSLEGHKSLIIFLSFSPDGRYIVSSGGDGTIRLWSVDQ